MKGSSCDFKKEINKSPPHTHTHAQSLAQTVRPSEICTFVLFWVINFFFKPMQVQFKVSIFLGAGCNTHGLTFAPVLV